MPLYLEQIRSLGLCPRLPAHSAVAPCSVLPLPPGGYSPVLHHCWRYWCCWYYRQPSVSCCRLWCCVCRWGRSSWASAKDPHISCETHACGERERERTYNITGLQQPLCLRICSDCITTQIGQCSQNVVPTITSYSRWFSPLVERGGRFGSAWFCNGHVKSIYPMLKTGEAWEQGYPILVFLWKRK